MSGAISERSKGSLRAWLRMLSCVTMVEQKLRGRFRESFGITLPQFDVLAELDHADKPQTMSELSRNLMVSNGNVTGVVDRLERANLVVRNASQSDRRVLYIDLTMAGREAFKQMARAHEEWIAELFCELSSVDLSKLSELLGNAKSSVKESTNRQ